MEFNSAFKGLKYSHIVNNLLVCCKVINQGPVKRIFTFIEEYDNSVWVGLHKTSYSVYSVS